MATFIADFRLAVLLILRARQWLIAAVLGILVALVAWLASEFSPRQPATVALDVGLSFIRIAVPLLALLQTQDLLAREIERRQILISLTYPRSRATFLIARYSAVVMVATAMTIYLSLILAAVVAFVGTGYHQQTPIALGGAYVLTIAFMLLDFAVVVAFAAALATISTTPNLVLLGGLGFMIAARSASTIVQLLKSDHNLVQGAQWYQQGLESVQWLIPDLAALDVRPIALYGKMALLHQSPAALLLMAIAYVAVLLALACGYFQRRQFA